MVVRYGALPLLVQLFNSKDPLVCEQALCVLDNICHDNECFDDINVDGFIERLLFSVNDSTPVSRRSLSYSLISVHGIINL